MVRIEGQSYGTWLYAPTFSLQSLTPHRLPYRIFADTQLLGGVFDRANLSVGLPHPLLEGRVGWVGAQRLPCLLEVPRHRGAVEAEACGDLNRHLREEQRTHTAPHLLSFLRSH